MLLRQKGPNPKSTKSNMQEKRVDVLSVKSVNSNEQKSGAAAHESAKSNRAPFQVRLRFADDR